MTTRNGGQESAVYPRRVPSSPAPSDVFDGYVAVIDGQHPVSTDWSKSRNCGQEEDDDVVVEGQAPAA
jgi:hypothetical protein